MSLTSILLHFECSACKYTEDVGIGVQMGLVIRGNVTFICPRCGHIAVAENICAILPTKFQSERGPRTFSSAPPPEAP